MTFDFGTVQWLVVLAFGFGGVIGTLRWNNASMKKAIEDQTVSMNRRFDEFAATDKKHDLQISENTKEIAVIKTTLTHQDGWLREMRDNLREIYSTIVGGGK